MYNDLGLITKEITLSSGELIKLLERNGWVFDRQKGSHKVYIKAGVHYHITVPHPEKDIAKGTLRKILKMI